MIRLPNQNYDKKQGSVKANNNEQQILKSFASVKFNKQDVAELLDISVSRAYKFLSHMVEKGFLGSEKEGKHLTYYVVE